MRQVLLDPPRGADEIQRVVRVLFHARCHGQDVGIEDDVFGRKADFIHENPVGALRNANLVLVTRGLALLVKRHHHRSRAILQNRPRMFAKFRLALLERNRIHNALALYAFQARLNHFPLRRVHHERHFGHFRLAPKQLQVTRHRGYAVDHALVHADVEHVGAVFHLLPGHADGLFVLALFDEPGELRRPGHIGPLADEDKDARLLREGLRTRQPQRPRSADSPTC